MRSVIAIVIVIVPVIVFSQSSLYMPLDIKAAYDKGTRSYDGTPGPNYWQNRAEYKIRVTIEPGTRLLSGDETITYYNNSPDTLKDLVIRLYQNINAPGAPRDFELPEEALTDGVEIQELTVNGIDIDLDDKAEAEQFATNLILHLDPPLLPNSVAEITASWNFTIPKGQNIRMGTYDSTTFFVAYWYPQVAVYDDIHGWDRTAYTGLLEFYNDFNDYDVEISVPQGYYVWSTGVLQNPEEVYSPEILARYNLALQSDSVIHIITEDDWKTGNITNDLRGAERRGNPINETNNLTWHIYAASVPDFAFAVSDSWLWDALSIDLSLIPPSKGDRGMGGGRTGIPACRTSRQMELNKLLEQGVMTPCSPSRTGILNESTYGLVESRRPACRFNRQILEQGTGQKKSPLNKGGTKRRLSNNNRVLISAVYNKSSADFYEVAAISRQTIEYFSKVFPAVPYLYPRMTVFNGSGGMEFPMMVNEGSSAERKWTVYVTTHEIAHTYFPFYMGINERKYAWMDEGWAQIFSERAQKLVAPDLDQQARNVFRFLNYSGNEDDVPMMVTTDNVHNVASYGNSSYFRPCNAYNFLEDALGRELFLKALHEYIARWHGKHPIPYDFFFTFESMMIPPLKGDRGMGGDLDWFFKPWFFEQGYPDLSIANATFNAGVLKITVEKLGNLPVPIYLTLKTSDGDSLMHSEACNVWKDGNKEAVLELKTNKTIKSIYLGNPYIPDALPENNTFIVK